MEEILRKADELDCDVIIMRTHGKGIISHTFLGSVAEKVLRRVGNPVFIIPSPRGETDTHSTIFRDPFILNFSCPF